MIDTNLLSIQYLTRRKTHDPEIPSGAQKIQNRKAFVMKKDGRPEELDFVKNNSKQMLGWRYCGALQLVATHF